MNRSPRLVTGLVMLIALALPGSGVTVEAAPGSPPKPEACGPGQAAGGGAAYEVASAGPAELNAVNDAHHFRVRFSPDGVLITPKTPSIVAWKLRLTLLRHGHADDVRETARPLPLALGERIETSHDSRLTEWFLNGPKGLQHGLDLPAGTFSGPLVFDFALETTLALKVSPDRRSVRFLDTIGTTLLAYHDLRVVDAEGRGAAARWEVTNAGGDGGVGLRLRVDATELVAPMMVRGLLTSPKYAGSAVARPVDEVERGGFELMAAPSNDACEGAETVPGAGPFPYLSGTYDITDATTAGDPPTPSCQANISRSVWFRFTPSVTGIYTFSLCGDAPTATTVEDTMLAIYSSPGSCAGFSEVGGGCDDDSCAIGDTQSVVNGLQLTAGTTYYVVAWQFGSTPPPAGSAAVQLRVTQEPPPPGAPANDQCAGSQAIPGAGPFPYLTTTVSDISGATTAGDPPSPTCQSLVSRSVWYSFMPATTASYSFSLCADAPTATTVDDTVLAIYGSNGACSGLEEVAGGCNDDFNCVVEPTQSALSGVTLTAGATYYVVAWQFDTGPPAAGHRAVQLRVEQSLVPGNDTCAAAVNLALDTPVIGTTLGALDGYQLPAASTCFAGLGQSVTIAAGRDVVYRYTAPAAGAYSFRVSDYGAGNAVLYAAGDCPVAGPPANITTCLGAANRNSTTPGSEAVRCLALAAGESVYVYVDEIAASIGGSFTIEVNECAGESDTSGNTNTNNTPANANTFVCGIEGWLATFDVDFFSLGALEAGARVFALLDGVAANATDFDLRVTNTADTLEYDHQDNDALFGGLSPNLAGTPFGGASAYLRLNYRTTSSADPYRLYAAVQPPSAGATPEVEPNNSIAAATPGASLYFSGVLGGTSDVDIFSFAAVAGDLIHVGLDLDPTRENTPFNGSLSLLDASGALLVVVNDANAISSVTSGTGSLTSTSPNSPADSLTYRARSGGTYYAKVEYSSGTPGDYLLSIARDCRIGPPTDIGVDVIDAPDPVAPGANVVYTTTVDNLGSSPAAGVILQNDLDPGAVFVAASPSQGSCAGTGPVSCALGSIASGASATVQIEVTAPGSPGSILNGVAVTSTVIDPNPSNDSSVELTTVGSLDADGDGVPDASDCAPGDPSAWTVPGPAENLLFPGPDVVTMQWNSPGAPGGPGIVYDLLRSIDRTTWAAATCVATGLATTMASDPETPPVAYYYLVRARNICGANMGTDSSGVPHTAPGCP